MVKSILFHKIIINRITITNKNRLFCVYFNMVTRIITLFGGIAILIFGFNLISANTERLAEGRAKNIIRKNLKTPIGGLLTGTVVAGVTQSSVAVSVIAVSLVEAGTISFRSSAVVIMGANVGTTVTAQLLSLSGASGGIIGSIASIIGLLLSFSKNKTVKRLSNSVMGLGVLFAGLSIMTTSVKGLISAVWFRKIFLVESPFLLFLNGMVLTGITQSSSAVTGVTVILGASKIMPFTSATFFTLGANVGSCFFVVLSSLNKNVNARRSALFNLIFNLSGAILFFPFLLMFGEGITHLFVKERGVGGAIADFHTVFNLVCALVFFPFLGLFEKLIIKITSNNGKNCNQNRKRKSFTANIPRFN